MRLYIVRHGQSFANVGREKESVNSPLTDLGKQQAEDAGKFFRDMPDFQFDKVFLSP